MQFVHADAMPATGDGTGEAEAEHMVESSAMMDAAPRGTAATRPLRRPAARHAAADHPAICPGSTPAGVGRQQCRRHMPSHL